MLRVRTQSWIDYMPSLLHYQRGPADQAPYREHIISQCPASRAMLHDPKFFIRFQGLTRMIDTQPFQLLDSEEQIRVAPGNPQLTLMRKDFHTWRQKATVMCGEFAHALRMHLRPLQPIVPSLSSDDDSSRESNDQELSSLTSPPKFKISSAPPHKDCLEPLNSKGKQLVGQHILYKWHGYEWCQGIITKLNDNPATVMGSDSAIVNFTLQWKDDNSSPLYRQLQPRHTRRHPKPQVDNAPEDLFTKTHIRYL